MTPTPQQEQEIEKSFKTEIGREWYSYRAGALSQLASVEWWQAECEILRVLRISADLKYESCCANMTAAAKQADERDARVEELEEEAAQNGHLANVANDRLSAANARVEALEKEVGRLKTSANFYRDLGITTMDAKWLDPECHKGCQSLVYKARITALECQVVALREALEIAAPLIEELSDDLEVGEANGPCAANRCFVSKQLSESALALTAESFAGKCVVDADRLAELEADQAQFEWIVKNGATVAVQEGSVGNPDLCEAYLFGRGIPSGVGETFRAAIADAMGRGK